MTQIDTDVYVPIKKAAEKSGLTVQRVNQLKNAGIVRTVDPYQMSNWVFYCLTDVLDHIDKRSK